MCVGYANLREGELKRFVEEYYPATFLQLELFQE